MDWLTHSNGCYSVRDGGLTDDPGLLTSCMTCWFSLPLSPEVHQWPLFCTDQGVARLREYLCCSFKVRLIATATIGSDLCEDGVEIFVAQILILLASSFHSTPVRLPLILPFFHPPPHSHPYTLTLHSWYTYSAMNRIYKHYAFNISRSPATTVMSFSSYPGYLSSLDDFYIMDRLGERREL